MSMTVDNVSYLAGTRQNMRASTAEKQEQKGGSTGVGKTLQSAVSTSLDQVNMGQLSPRSAANRGLCSLPRRSSPSWM